MLNGVAPILIFSFMPNLTQGLFKGLAGIPILGDIVPNIGIPIPLYLDEKLTGIYIENESKAIDIDTNVQARYDGKAPSVDQRGINNLITVNMLANRNSIMLSVLLALNDMIFQRVVSKDYSVTYLNGASTIFNALLHGFSTQGSSEDELIHISLQLSKANQSKPNPANLTSVLPKITGATPVAVP